MNRAQTNLLNEGWTQKELNFIGFYTTIHLISPRTLSVYPYSDSLKYLRHMYNNRSSSSKPTSNSEFISYINTIRRGRADYLGEIGPEIQSLEIKRGCENLFSSATDDSNTEAGAECVDCQVSSNSEGKQIEEQIESIQNRLAQSNTEENQLRSTEEQRSETREERLKRAEIRRRIEAEYGYEPYEHRTIQRVNEAFEIWKRERVDKVQERRIREEISRRVDAEYGLDPKAHKLKTYLVSYRLEMWKRERDSERLRLAIEAKREEGRIRSERESVFEALGKELIEDLEDELKREENLKIEEIRRRIEAENSHEPIHRRRHREREALEMWKREFEERRGEN